MNEQQIAKRFNFYRGIINPLQPYKVIIGDKEIIIPIPPFKVMMADVSSNDARLTSRFLQCLNLSEWVKTSPDIFLIQNEVGDKITYSGVQWGEVFHSCPDEMSACHADVKFTYTKKEMQENAS